MNANIWTEILKQYEAYEVEKVIPIAHTRIRPDIGILLDENGNFIGATLINNERCSIPCTIESESRTSGVSPHPIHDNMSYVCGEYEKYRDRHEAYMDQLARYVESSDDDLARIVLRYLQKGTIRGDIESLLNKVPIGEEKAMIVFATSEHRDPISEKWTAYYLDSLEKNGICGLTGELDHIPAKYPKGIRNPADMARLFTANQKPLDSMPAMVPGYVAEQKILHTLQFMIYEGTPWAYNILKENRDLLPDEWKKKVERYYARKGK